MRNTGDAVQPSAGDATNADIVALNDDCPHLVNNAITHGLFDLHLLTRLLATIDSVRASIQAKHQYRRGHRENTRMIEGWYFIILLQKPDNTVARFPFAPACDSADRGWQFLSRPSVRQAVRFFPTPSCS